MKHTKPLLTIALALSTSLAFAQPPGNNNGAGQNKPPQNNQNPNDPSDKPPGEGKHRPKPPLLEALDTNGDGDHFRGGDCERSRVPEEARQEWRRQDHAGRTPPRPARKMALPPAEMRTTITADRRSKGPPPTSSQARETTRLRMAKRAGVVKADPARTALPAPTTKRAAASRPAFAAHVRARYG